jgi:hypothetical protein
MRHRLIAWYMAIFSSCENHDVGVSNPILRTRKVRDTLHSERGNRNAKGTSGGTEASRYGRMRGGGGTLVGWNRHRSASGAVWSCAQRSRGRESARHQTVVSRTPRDCSQSGRSSVGRSRQMSLRRPKRDAPPFLGKPKKADPDPPMHKLKEVAGIATYDPSPYHCPGPKGQPPKRRAKPASRCPRAWTNQEIIGALHKALLGGHVSSDWDGDFPRYAYHREGKLLYAARGCAGGIYHAYPLEPGTVVVGLRI